MNKKVLVVVVIAILLAIPATLMITSGELFPPEDPPYRVAVISDYSNTETIYVHNGVAGVEKAARSSDTPIEPALYMAADREYDSYMIAFEEAIADGYDLIVAPGYDAIEAEIATAWNHPEVEFLTIDATVDEYPPNFANIIFRSNEPSFVAGYLAGMMTESRAIGYLGGVKIDSVTIFYYGFRAGIDLAILERDESIRLVDVYADTFADEELGYTLTDAMYRNGVDNVFTVAGNTGLGGIQAAKDKNKYVIGVDVDQNYLAPKNVICSVVKDLIGITATIVVDYAHGVDYGGGPISTGYKEGALHVASIIDDVPDDLKEEAAKLEYALSMNLFDIPKTEAEYHSWAPARAAAILSEVQENYEE